MRSILPVATLLLLAASGAALAAETGATPGLRLAAGSVATRQVVAIGRDLALDGEALADVAALDGSVTVTGRVRGDLIVLGGDARLAESARVEGDVFVLGGRLEAARGAFIGGQSAAYPTVSRAWLTLLEGPSLGLDATSTMVLGAKLALVVGWLALCLALFATSGREVLATADEIRREPFRSFATGLVGVLALTVTALFLSSLLGGLASVPLLVLVIVLALLLKLWGMIALFHACGGWLAQHVLHRRLIALHAAVCGLLVLAVVKLVPYVGLWVWTAATLIAVGATLRSKFGRREPWLQDAPAASFASL
jgi:hypothetical protein